MQKTAKSLFDVNWIDGRAIEVFFLDAEMARTRRLPRVVLVGVFSRLPAEQRRIRSVPDELPCIP